MRRFTFNRHLHRDSTLLLSVFLPTCTMFKRRKVLIIYPSSYKRLWTLLSSAGPHSRCLSVITLVRMIWNLTVAGKGVSSDMLLITGSLMYKFILQKLTVSRFLKNSQRFMESEGFNTVFMKACQQSFSWVRGIQSTPSRPMSFEVYFLYCLPLSAKLFRAAYFLSFMLSLKYGQFMCVAYKMNAVKKRSLYHQFN